MRHNNSSMHNSSINMAVVDLFGNKPSFATSVNGYMRAIERDFGLDVCNVDFIGTYIDHVVGSFVSNDGVAVPSPTVFGGPVLDDLFGSWDWDDAGTFDEETADDTAQQRNRLPNEWGYAFGDIYKANWYTKFLAPDVRARTYRCSTRNRYGPFRSHFRLPLWIVDELTHKFMDNDRVTYTKRIQSYDTLFLRTQLHILTALEVLASNTPFSRKLETSTNISTEDHRLFFHLFLEKMFGVRGEYISVSC